MGVLLMHFRPLKNLFHHIIAFQCAVLAGNWAQTTYFYCQPLKQTFVHFKYQATLRALFIYTNSF